MSTLNNYPYGPWGAQNLATLQPIQMPGQPAPPPSQSVSALQQMAQAMQQLQQPQQQPRAANGQFVSQLSAMLGSGQSAPTLGMDNSYMGYGAQQGSPSWGMDASGAGGAGFMGYGA